jgi:hypothetical protein
MHSWASHTHLIPHVGFRCAHPPMAVPVWSGLYLGWSHPPDLDIFKGTLPQHSLSNVTYIVQVAVNYSYVTPDDGYGNYPKHVEWPCNKIKIVLHLVGHFMCICIHYTYLT